MICSDYCKKSYTTKIHALVDALGNPLKFTLTPGQRNEITQAQVLTESIYNSTVVADKGYDSNAFVIPIPITRQTDGQRWKKSHNEVIPILIVVQSNRKHCRVV